MLIELNDASFGYARRAVVHVGHLELRAGASLGLFGPNGSGKTTLLRGMCGLLRPMHGAARRRAGLRIAYVPQHRTMELHWPMTALDVASMQRSARRMFGWVRADRRRIVEAMAAMHVESLAGAPFARLSGGQQQRVILAGALADDPEILVLDEPTEGLDAASQTALRELLRNRCDAGMALLLISHNRDDLRALADQVATLQPRDAGPTEVTLS